MANIFHDVACTVCGCVCDDLSITVENGRITRAEKACALAEPWFLGQNAVKPPIAEIDGQEAPLDAAIQRAVELLKAAKSPLIYGLSRSTTEGQRAATTLADKLGATIDTTASTGHAPSIIALQQVGESTCTLGEVKNRPDLVIFWGSDPVHTHPRHLERYCPNTIKRYMIVADVHETDSAKLVDEYLPVEPGQDWETLWKLRMLLKGKLVAASDNLVSLAARMKACRFGIVFFGTGLTRGPLGHRNVEALLQLVTDLNDHTRFYARRMRRYGDVAGADSVLTWQTGYPFGVNFARGYPRYNPGEFTGPDMLMRNEVDVCVVIGSDTLSDFPPAAIANLRKIPVILLDSPGISSLVSANVKFTTAVYGVHRPGTAYRMDEVPIPLRVLLPTDYPSDGEVLGAILKGVENGESP